MVEFIETTTFSVAVITFGTAPTQLGESLMTYGRLHEQKLFNSSLSRLVHPLAPTSLVATPSSEPQTPARNARLANVNAARNFPSAFEVAHAKHWMKN